METTPGNKSDQRRTEAKHSKKITTAITYASILTALAVPIHSIPELKAKGDKNLKNTTEKTGILTGQAKAIETPKRPITEEEDTELAIEKADSLAEKGDYENAIKILLKSITSYRENPSQDIETHSSALIKLGLIYINQFMHEEAEGPLLKPLKSKRHSQTKTNFKSPQYKNFSARST